MGDQIREHIDERTVSKKNSLLANVHSVLGGENQTRSRLASEGKNWAVSGAKTAVLNNLDEVLSNRGEQMSPQLQEIAQSIFDQIKQPRAFTQGIEVLDFKKIGQYPTIQDVSEVLGFKTYDGNLRDALRNGRVQQEGHQTGAIILDTIESKSATGNWLGGVEIRMDPLGKGGNTTNTDQAILSLKVLTPPVDKR